MAFCDTQDFVDRLYPGTRERLTFDDGRKDGTQRFSEPENTKENGVHGLSLRVQERPKPIGSIFGDETGIDKKGNELIPGKIACCGREIGEIEGQPSGNEGNRVRGHITGEKLQAGYIRRN